MPWISKSVHQHLVSRAADAEKAEEFLRTNGFSFGVYGGRSWTYDGRERPGAGSVMERVLLRVRDSSRREALRDAIVGLKLKAYKVPYGEDLLEGDLKVDKERRAAKAEAKEAKLADDLKADAMARLRGK